MKDFFLIVDDIIVSVFIYSSTLKYFSLGAAGAPRSLSPMLASRDEANPKDARIHPTKLPTTVGENSTPIRRIIQQLL